MSTESQMVSAAADDEILEKMGKQLKPFTMDEINNINAPEAEILDDVVETPLEILQLKPNVKRKILLSVEEGVKEIVDRLADIKDSNMRNRMKGKNIPTSKIGVLVHYLVEGIKRDFNMKFDKTPYSIERFIDKPIGKDTTIKDRLERGGYGISRKEKNELTAAADYFTYLPLITAGEMSVEEADGKMKEARDKITALAAQGVFISAKKTQGLATFDWKVEVRTDREVEDERWKLYQKNSITIKVPNILSIIADRGNGKYYDKELKTANFPDTSMLLDKNLDMKDLHSLLYDHFPRMIDSIDEETKNYDIVGVHIAQITKPARKGASLKKLRYICLDFENENGEQMLYLFNDNDMLMNFKQ